MSSSENRSGTYNSTVVYLGHAGDQEAPRVVLVPSLTPGDPALVGADVTHENVIVFRAQALSCGSDAEAESCGEYRVGALADGCS